MLATEPVRTEQDWVDANIVAPAILDLSQTLDRVDTRAHSPGTRTGADCDRHGAAPVHVESTASRHRKFAHACALIIDAQDTDNARTASVQFRIRDPYSLNENFSFLADKPRC